MRPLRGPRVRDDRSRPDSDAVDEGGKAVGKGGAER